MIEPRRLTQRLVTPHPERLAYIRYAFRAGMSVREVARMTSHGPVVSAPDEEITDDAAKLSEIRRMTVITDDAARGQAHGHLR